MDYLNVLIRVTMIDLQLFVRSRAEHLEIYKMVSYDPCLGSFGNRYKGLPRFNSSCDTPLPLRCLGTRLVIRTGRQRSAAQRLATRVGCRNGPESR